MRETHEEPGAEIRDESSESRDERSESKLDSTFSPPLGYSVKGDGRGGSTFGPLSHWLALVNLRNSGAKDTPAAVSPSHW